MEIIIFIIFISIIVFITIIATKDSYENGLYMGRLDAANDILREYGIEAIKYSSLARTGERLEPKVEKDKLSNT